MLEINKGDGIMVDFIEPPWPGCIVKQGG